MVAAQNGVAIDICGLHQRETSFAGVGKSGAGGGVQNEAAASDHGVSSVALGITQGKVI
jgi:hypothetical protein